VAKADYGLPLPWYFPCTPSFWCPGSVKAPPNDDDSEPVYGEGVAVEEVSNTLKEQTSNGRSIELRKLRKVFGEKTAVDGLSMSFYSGQITALLGHNGAGKFFLLFQRNLVCSRSPADKFVRYPQEKQLRLVC
jgi:ABC-type multidrug transport system fused ATPase/permease subunit